MGACGSKAKQPKSESVAVAENNDPKAEPKTAAAVPTSEPPVSGLKKKTQIYKQSEINVLNMIQMDDTEKGIMEFYPETKEFKKKELPEKCPFKKFMAGGVISKEAIVLTGGEGEGDNASKAVRTTVMYDPVANTWKEQAPMYQERMHHAAIIKDNFLYVFGGVEGKSGTYAVPMKSCEAFDLTKREWNKLPDMTEGRSGASVFAWGDYIYLLGGQRKIYSYYSRKISRFDTVKNVWEELPAKLPFGMTNFVLVPSPIPNEVFLLGGAFEKMYVAWNLQTNSMNVVGRTAKNRGRPKLMFYKEKYYLIGGDQDLTTEEGTFLHEAQEFEWKVIEGLKFQDTWKASLWDLADAWNPIIVDHEEKPSVVRKPSTAWTYDAARAKDYVFLFSGAFVKRIDIGNKVKVEYPIATNFSILDHQVGITLPDGRIFLAGGQRDSAGIKKLSKKAAIFNPVDGTFTLVAKMNTARDSAAIAFSSPQIFLIGGKSQDPMVYLKECERYDTVQKKWHKLPNLPKPLANAVAVATELGFFVLGGLNALSQPTHEIHQFNLEENVWNTLSLHLPMPLENFAPLWDQSSSTLYILGGKSELESKKVWKLENPGDLAMFEECGELESTGPSLKIKKIDYDQCILFGGRADCFVEIYDVTEKKTIQPDLSKQIYELLKDDVESDKVFLETLIL